MPEPIWFGVRGNMRWVNAPAPVSDGGKKGWASSTQLLNGKKYVRRSVASHKEYSLEWSLGRREDLQPILDYADGLYGLGKIFWVDPFAADRNMFPTDWASPFQGALGGTVLDGGNVRPTTTPTTPNVLNYPVDSVQYNMNAASRAQYLWLPIPPGYQMRLGVHGRNGSGGRVRWAPTANGVAGTAANFSLLATTSNQRTNVTVSSETADGVEIALGGSGTVIVSAMTAYLQPIGASAQNGSFIPGLGHAGCTFEDQPTVELYNAAIDLIGINARLIESL